MKLGKHTLVIDGNYFVHSRLFVLPRKKGQVLLSDDESKKIAEEQREKKHQERRVRKELEEKIQKEKEEEAWKKNPSRKI